VGHHDEAKLPILAGQTIVIPRGITVRSYQPSRKVRTTVRSQTVVVDHVLGGMDTRCAHVAIWDRESRFSGNTELFATYDLAYEAMVAEHDPVRLAALREFVYSLRVPMTNPEVRWAGARGYWCWVDINDLLGTPKVSSSRLEELLQILNTSQH
jgi:hypothetical protein